MSHGTPDLDIVLRVVKKQLFRLEHGIKLNCDSLTKFFLIAGVFDKPARSKAIKMKNSTGFSSCLRCIQPGETFKTKSKYFFCSIVAN